METYKAILVVRCFSFLGERKYNLYTTFNMDISVVLDMRRWLSVAAFSLGIFNLVCFYTSENPLSEML